VRNSGCVSLEGDATQPVMVTGTDRFSWAHNQPQLPTRTIAVTASNL
jgi:hypothetical protein